ncbi:MAG: nuclear transport factor 2 family protein [Phycisphaerales bacterium]|nr:nuclear transport factor 2 family protein [Planctomycetota bacterium]
MQSPLQLPDAPPPLSEPLTLSILLFEQPWIFMLCSLLAGLLAALFMRRRGEPSKGIVFLLCGAFAAGAFFALAKLVVTDREQIARRSQELLRATAKVDLPALESLLDPGARMIYFRAPAGLDKPGIIAAVRTDLGQTYRVKDWAIQELQIAPSRDLPDRMNTQMRVRVTPEAWNFPHVSWWAIEWRRSGNTWQAVAIRPLAIQFYQGTP